MALIFQLHGLSDEDKLRALQLRASRRGLHLTDEVGRFILNRGSRSMNSLFDLLEQLDRASLQAQRKLTIPFLGNPRLVGVDSPSTNSRMAVPQSLGFACGRK